MLSLLIAAACLVVLLLATRVAPDRGGMGTHRRLGLGQCQFLIRTGLPCPSCGMTTSFAHFVRGELAASAYVQPAGFILAVLTSICFWAGIYVAAMGKPVQRILGMLPAGKIIMILMGISVLAWAWKILIHLGGLDGMEP